MKRLAWIPIAVLILGAAPPPGPVQFVELGSARSGRLIVLGNLLPGSTFRFQAKVVIVGADTSWQGLYVNGLSLRAPDADAKRAVLSPAEDQRLQFMRRAAAGIADSARTRESRGRVMNVGDRTDLLVRQYQGEPTLVDSVRKESPTSVRVFWRAGDPEGELMVMEQVANTPPAPGQVMRSIGLHMRDMLDRGYWVCVRNGGAVALFTPPHRAAELQAEIAALRNGKPIEQSIILDRAIARDIQQPSFTIEQLRAKGPR